jgi:hypothetical protein
MSGKVLQPPCIQQQKETQNAARENAVKENVENNLT